MKIVVLAGGTSTERDVSIVSGTGICGALRQKGHQAILVDVFCGQEEVDWEDPFPAEYDVEKAAAYIRGFNLQMAELKKTRKISLDRMSSIFVKKQILFSWDFMEPTGRTVNCREHLI
mgnify:CR=1 FL=1